LFCLVKEELVKVLFAAQIAWTLHNKGKMGGILDVDLCGPSIPRMMNVEGKDIHQCWVFTSIFKRSQ